MRDSTDESAPLLQFPGSFPSQQLPIEPQAEPLPDSYKQFCYLVGNRPTDHPAKKTYYPPKDSLYYRAVEHRKAQGRMYAFTSALTNTLLLSQVVLGASLTGMGASNSPGWLITIFGALNTIIAGLVAFLKSRGQPMRARMFRDDLDRVCDEIENSATMWRGISQGIHGYDAIDTDEAVTVRSEVARLTRLYDRAVKTSTMNDPDYYGGAGINSDTANSGLRSRPEQSALPALPAPAPPASTPLPAQDTTSTPAPAAAAPAADPDQSPATKAPESTPKQDASSTAGNAPSGATESANPPEQSAATPSVPTSAPDTAASAASAPAQTQLPAIPPPPAASLPPVAVATILDPDASPATASRPPGAERSKSNKQTTKVTEDLSQDPGQTAGGAAKST